MITLQKYNPTLRVLFVVLFLLSGSGFSTVLHLCAMEAAECCDPSGASDHKACQHEELPLVSGEALSGTSPCHMNLVAGGLSGIQGLVEKDSNQRTIKVELLAVIVLTADNLASSSSIDHILVAISEPPSPPSVEKHVLNETFLI